MKRDGKEVGPASVYAEPHTMSGKKVTVAGAIKDKSGAQVMDDMNISVGNISKSIGKGVKTDGIETRGNGAATKGRIARGPMA
jgi:formylmethanofuran dehydrogenase subunit C